MHMGDHTQDGQEGSGLNGLQRNAQNGVCCWPQTYIAMALSQPVSHNPGYRSDRFYAADAPSGIAIAPRQYAC